MGEPHLSLAKRTLLFVELIAAKSVGKLNPWVAGFNEQIRKAVISSTQLLIHSSYADNLGNIWISEAG